MGKGKPGAKLGEDIVAPKDEAVVTDPEAVEEALADTELPPPADMGDDSGTTASDTPEAGAGTSEAAAEPVAAVPPELDPINVAAGMTALLEGGSRVLLEDVNLPLRSFRVRSRDGRYWEHVADDPTTGEWIYRHCQ